MCCVWAWDKCVCACLFISESGRGVEKGMLANRPKRTSSVKVLRFIERCAWTPDCCVEWGGCVSE